MDTDRPASDVSGAGSESTSDADPETDGDGDDPGGTGPNVADGGIIEDRLAQLFRSGRTNALVAWGMVAVLALTFVESLLGFDWLPMILVAAITGVVVAPMIAARDPQVMLPWEVLGLALLPILVRTLLGGEVGTFAAYMALAAFALIITVELHMFTTLRVTHWFAVLFVVLTTMASAAAWTVLRWNADRLIGTEYLTTNEALMIEWLYVTLAGVAAGVLFDAYFRRRGKRLRRAIRRVVRR
ncbi:hypothetical protein [Halorubrum sp. HHNYT27]|uniref:hypothetical protein n=1 Tax=Halorubrum sp. HHNYT27 TaxID=3402275 RepID=UPI003EB81B07